jgi:hypothetical protein
MNTNYQFNCNTLISSVVGVVPHLKQIPLFISLMKEQKALKHILKNNKKKNTTNNSLKSKKQTI